MAGERISTPPSALRMDIYVPASAATHKKRVLNDAVVEGAKPDCRELRVTRNG